MRYRHPLCDTYFITKKRPTSTKAFNITFNYSTTTKKLNGDEGPPYPNPLSTLNSHVRLPFTNIEAILCAP